MTSGNTYYSDSYTPRAPYTYSWYGYYYYYTYGCNTVGLLSAGTYDFYHYDYYGDGSDAEVLIETIAELHSEPRLQPRMKATHTTPSLVDIMLNPLS